LSGQGGLSIDTDAIDQAIEADAERAFAFLERLVAEPSVVGAEASAQHVVAEELERLGFAVERLPIPADIGEREGAGVPSLPYEARDDVFGVLGPTEGRSLLVGGHIDVVPAEETGPWSTDPFVPTRRRGRMFGRGTGDMKGGFAMLSLAIDALRRVDPDAIGGPLRFVSVIEEECTGNGTLASCLAGQLADAVVLAEPTGLDLLVAGVGILWLEIAITGKAAHAQSANEAVNPIDEAIPVIGALRTLERAMNDDVDDPALEGEDHPYNINIGAIRAGDWASSVPAIARLDVRIGHPTAWTPDEAEEHVRSAVMDAARGDRWLLEHPPSIRQTGFRAQGYSLAADDPLAVALADAHEEAHGERPHAVGMGSTTDARYYVNGFDTPALCYGPSAKNIHGTDESVELASIVDGARTMARFMAAWYSTPGDDR
jgi:acetylornithine deacetylase